MTNRLRIAFVSCYEDPWAQAVGNDVCKAAETLGYEFFFIGGGAQGIGEEQNFINLSTLSLQHYLARFFISFQTREKGLEELVDCEVRFLEKEKRAGKSRGRVLKDMRQSFAEAQHVLKTIEPDFVIVWNGFLTKRAVYAHVAKDFGVPVFYAEKGMLPDSWYVDPDGINAVSSIVKQSEIHDVNDQVAEAWQKRIKMTDDKGRSMWEQPERKDIAALRAELGIREKQKVIFFPGQVDADSNIILFSPHFKDSRQALTWLTDGLKAEDYFILVKPHPKGNLSEQDFKDILGGRGSVLSDLNIVDAIFLSDCIVSINSTVSFEAVIRGKPVLLLGQSVLSRKTFVMEFESGKDASFQIEKCIRNHDLHSKKMLREAISFADYLDKQYYLYKGEEEKVMSRLEDAARGIPFIKKRLTKKNVIWTLNNSTSRILAKIKNILISLRFCRRNY